MNSINNIKVGTKLVGGFILIALIVVVVALVGYWNMKNIDDNVNSMYSERLLPIQDLYAADTEINAMTGDIYKVVFIPEQRATSIPAIKTEITNVDKEISSFKNTSLSDEEKDELAKFNSDWTNYQKVTNDILDQVNAGDQKDVLPKLGEGALEESTALSAEDSLTKLIQINVNDADGSKKESASEFNNANTILLIAGILGMLLAIGLGLIISRMITNPLSILVHIIKAISQGEIKQNIQENLRGRKDEIGIISLALANMIGYLEEIAGAAGQISNGDLTVEITPRSKLDILGNAITRMISNLNNTLHQTNSVTSQVVQAVEQVRAVSQDLSSNSQEQSSAVEEVASSVEETDSQVKASADHAEIANQLASQTTNLAMVGQEKMKALSQSINSISSSSLEISKIIKVIDEIAFQTNLLALNAAVEAARAGQYGKGFAVVAQEVRNLAERSAKAAKSTGELIEDSTRRVKEGVDMTDETARSLNDIVQNVVKVKDLVGEIAAASEEQTKALNQISQAITQVSQGTQSNSAQSEELAGTADELGGLAENLKQEVQRFKLKPENRMAMNGLPAGMTPEMFQAAWTAMQKSMSIDAEKNIEVINTGFASVDRDERGYGKF